MQIVKFNLISCKTMDMSDFTIVRPAPFSIMHFLHTVSNARPETDCYIKANSFLSIKLTCIWNPLSSLFSKLSRIFPNCASTTLRSTRPLISMFCRPPSLPAVSVIFSSTFMWTLEFLQKINKHGHIFASVYR